MREKVGVCQWFHNQDYESVIDSCRILNSLGVKHLRTGISWADYHRPGGYEWYVWMMEELQDFEILLSIWHTPPSISENGLCSGPPKRLEDFSDFIAKVNKEYGSLYHTLELWNEPNNRLKWDFINCDPQWKKFATMIRLAADEAKIDGKQTALGGMSPVDHHWIELIDSYKALENIDIIGIHGFPFMWWPDKPSWDRIEQWKGWSDRIEYVQSVTDKPIWVTETGVGTVDNYTYEPDRFDLQEKLLKEAAEAPVSRIYWYSLIDLAPHRDAIEGFHVDENEYHMGLFDYQCNAKPAASVLKELLF